MTIIQQRAEDAAHRAAVGAKTLRNKAPICVEITSKTRAGNGAVLMCKHCFGTQVVFHMAWYAMTCADCRMDMDKVGGYWLLKRP